MAVRTSSTREFKIPKLSALMGKMLIVKMESTTKRTTGEVSNTVTVLSDTLCEMFEVNLPALPDPAEFKKNDYVDFTDVTWLIRANGRNAGQFVLGEISDTIEAAKIIKFGTSSVTPTPNIK